MKRNYGLSLLLRRLEPDLPGVYALVQAAQTLYYGAKMSEENAELSLAAAGKYIGDDGQISDVQQGRVVAATSAEISVLRSIMREPSAESMAARLEALYATE